MLANLFGDFVKGKDYTYLPQIVQKGVLLHRQIDDFIDHHPHVTELRLNLYKDLPKIAGIAIDLYFDHLLAINWSSYHPQKLDAYIDKFLTYALNTNHHVFQENNFKYPPNYMHLLTFIQQHNWMKRYVNLEGIEMASKGLSKRISFDNNLGEATKVFKKFENEINAAFFDYMKDAQQFFKTPPLL
jgi:acyl carrier protein phosphodiesterase